MRNVSGGNGTVVNSTDGDRENFRAARESVTITKSKRNARVHSTGVNKSVCVYGFMFGEGEGNRNKEMIGGRRGGMNMGREMEEGSRKVRMRRERWRTGKGVEIGAGRRPLHAGCSPLIRGLRDLRVTP